MQSVISMTVSRCPTAPIASISWARVSFTGAAQAEEAELVAHYKGIELVEVRDNKGAVVRDEFGRSSVGDLSDSFTTTLASAAAMAAINDNAAVAMAAITAAIAKGRIVPRRGGGGGRPVELFVRTIEASDFRSARAGVGRGRGEAVCGVRN